MTEDQDEAGRLERLRRCKYAMESFDGQTIMLGVIAIELGRIADALTRGPGSLERAVEELTSIRLGMP